MASNNFTYSPTSGNGTTNVSVSVAGENVSGADKNTTLTFSNGTGSTNVTLKQKYKPFINVGPTSIPSSGGSQSITAHTEYDVIFRSVPSWITAITINNVTYQAGARIAANLVDGQIVNFYAEPNTGAQRNTGYSNMTMGWYMNSSDSSLVTTNTPIIDFTQASGSTPTPTSDDINIIVGFDNYTPRNNWTIMVSITSYNSTFNSRTFTLNALKPSDEDYITVALNTGGTTNLDVEVIVNTNASVPAGFTTNNICNYDGDTDTDPAVTLGDTSTFHYTYTAGEDMTITIGINM